MGASEASLQPEFIPEFLCGQREQVWAGQDRQTAGLTGALLQSADLSSKDVCWRLGLGLTLPVVLR